MTLLLFVELDPSKAERCDHPSPVHLTAKMTFLLNSACAGLGPVDERTCGGRRARGRGASTDVDADRRPHLCVPQRLYRPFDFRVIVALVLCLWVRSVCALC